MDIEDMHAVTPDEASYEVTKALLPFLIEAGTPVYTCRFEPGKARPGDTQ